MTRPNQRHICERGRGCSRALFACARLLACILGTCWLERATAHAQSPGSFAISGPRTLVLGRDTRATLRITAPSAARFHLYANAGQLGAASLIADGQWQVTYDLPAKKYPQVGVIVLISDDGAHFAWTQIALHGSARVELQSEPDVEVTVRVGDAEFGPTRTDHAGHAELPVVVPPGNTTALSIATDALGNQKEQTISLGVPAFQRLLSVCPAQQALGFWAFVIDERGYPQLDAQLQASGTGVRATAIQQQAPGVYRVTFKAGDDARGGDSVWLSAALRSAANVAHACESAMPVAQSAPSLVTNDASEPDAVESSLHKRFVLAIQSGYMTNFAKLGAPQIGLRAGMRLPFAGQRFSLELQGSFHTSQHQGRSSDGLETIRTNVSALPILLRAGFTQRMRQVDVWLFGAAGAMFSSSEVRAPLLGQTQEHSTNFAYAVGSGVGLALGPGHAALELSYLQAAIDARMLSGNAGGLSAALGYVLEL